MPLSASDRQEQLVRAYVEAYGLTAVSIVIINGRPMPQVETIDNATLRTPFDWKATRAGIWWCADAGAAMSVFSNRPTAAGDDFERSILLGAERAKVKLTDHATLMQRAQQAVALVEQRIRRMQENGEMKALNTEYQDARLFAKERGRNFQPFWAWLHKRKVAMVEDVARAASGRKVPAPRASKRG